MVCRVFSATLLLFRSFRLSTIHLCKTDEDGVTDFLNVVPQMFLRLLYRRFRTSKDSDAAALRLGVLSATEEESPVFKDDVGGLDTEVLDTVSEADSSIEDDGAKIDSAELMFRVLERSTYLLAVVPPWFDLVLERHSDLGTRRCKIVTWCNQRWECIGFLTILRRYDSGRLFSFTWLFNTISQHDGSTVHLALLKVFYQSLTLWRKPRCHLRYTFMRRG